MLKLNRKFSVAGLFAAIGASALAVPAHAADPAAATASSAVQLNTVSMLYKQWDNTIIPKAQQKCSGSGYWDPQVAFDSATGDIAVLASVSTKDANNANSHMQAGLGILKMTEAGLTKVTELTDLPHLDGERAFMRPTLAKGSNFYMALGASEDSGLNNGNPQVVAFIYDRAGKLLPITNSTRGNNINKPTNLVQLAQVTTNVNKNNQHGPHSVAPLGPQADGSEGFIVGVQQNNQQAQIMKVLVKVDAAGKATVTVPYLKTIINNAQHNRVSLATPTDGFLGDTVVATSVEANQQPANVGVRAVLVDTKTGDVVASKLVAKSDNNAKIYAVQPTAAYISPGVVGIQYVLSQAKGPGGNNNGHANNTIAQKSMLATFSVTADKATAFTQLDVLERPAAYQRHAASFGTKYGQGAGVPAISILTGSSTGNGPGIQQVIPIDPTTGKIGALSAGNMYEISKFSDVGENCALNMRDPGQARCFLNGWGGIANPGYQKATGFMPEVKEFTFTAVGAKAAVTDNRLSLFLNLVPTTWDPAVAKTVPGVVKDPSEVPPGPSPVVTVPDGSGTTGTASGDPFGEGSSDSTSSTGDSTSSGSNDGKKAAGYGDVPQGSGGCSVSTTSTSSSGLGGLALVGLGLALVAARRNSKKEQ